MVWSRFLLISFLPLSPPRTLSLSLPPLPHSALSATTRWPRSLSSRRRWGSWPSGATTTRRSNASRRRCRRRPLRVPPPPPRIMGTVRRRWDEGVAQTSLMRDSHLLLFLLQTPTRSCEERRCSALCLKSGAEAPPPSSSSFLWSPWGSRPLSDRRPQLKGWNCCVVVSHRHGVTKHSVSDENVQILPVFFLKFDFFFISNWPLWLTWGFGLWSKHIGRVILGNLTAGHNGGYLVVFLNEVFVNIRMLQKNVAEVYHRFAAGCGLFFFGGGAVYLWGGGSRIRQWDYKADL